MAIIDNLQKISDTVWELPGELQARHARAGADHRDGETGARNGRSGLPADK
jgi:hypothetical protein